MAKILRVKIRQSERGSSAEYKNEVRFEDFKQLAIFLVDLESYGGNIEKAFQEYLKLRQEKFPW